MSRIFSGIKPTGTIHLGNYLGALQQWISLQDAHECIFSVVDLHAITVPQDPAALRQHVLETTAMYLACGIDPEKSLVFVQSEVAAHTELSWLLNALTKVSELKLMHQFKEKSKDAPEHITAALFDYPVLMAADILLYGAERVPVGEDQVQHLELARELARRFNAQYGELFTIPEGMVSEMGARIMSLDDPKKKMSKSARSSHTYIALTDTPDEVRAKIARATTDSERTIRYAKQRAALANLMTIYSRVTGMSYAQIEAEYEGKGYKEFKEGLAEVLVVHLAPIQERYAHLLADPTYLKGILSQGAVKARVQADAMLVRAKNLMGLGV